VIVFGVTGAGKSLIGKQLAQQLGWTFHDADDYHSPQNLDKLKRGIALTDDDRRPWLDRLREVIVGSQARREPMVLATSALKLEYRRRLSTGPGVTFVYLKADKALIADRLRRRSGHFMNPGLIDSQFATLEEPRADEHAIVIDASAAPDEIVRQIKFALKG
jgi:gluconokinase